MFAGSGQVENSGSGTITALDGAVTLTIPTSASAGIHITGTWSATLTFEATVDGTNWFTVPVTTLPAGAQVTTTTTNNAYTAGVGGYQSFRIRASSFTSGTVAVAWTSDNTPNISSTVQQGNPPWSVSLSSITAVITPSFSPKTRVDSVIIPVILVTSSFTTCYTYSGTGYFLGLSAEFNNNGITPRLQIDGDTVFTGISMSGYGDFQVTANSVDRRQAGHGIVTSGSNLDFSLKQPVRFNTSITLSAEAGGGAVGSRQMARAMIYIVKET